MKSLNKLRRLRHLLVDLKRAYLRRVWGIDIHPTAQISLSAKFDLTYPKGVHVGAHSYIAFEARILTHDMTRNIRRDTRVGENCFIGGRSMILPGVVIGSGCIVGAGAVVTKSVPDNCIVAGNPAQIIRRDIRTLSYGRVDPVWAREQEALRAAGAAGRGAEAFVSSAEGHRGGVAETVSAGGPVTVPPGLSAAGRTEVDAIG